MLCNTNSSRVKMPIRSSAVFLSLSVSFGLSLFITHGSTQTSEESEIPCQEEGFCVSSFLCSNGTIITSGDGLIDLRFAGNDCPNDLICCQVGSLGSKITQCQGTCVSLFQCLDDVFDDSVIENGVLDSGTTNCPENLICCSKVRQSSSINLIESYQQCQGKCVPFHQCSGEKLNTAGKDIINLRITDDGCSGKDLVCCLGTEVLKPNIDVPKICNGTCVPFYQCLNGTFNSPGQGVISLRSFDDACPDDFVCCNVKSKPDRECHGRCVSFSQCPKESRTAAEKDLIDLRYTNDGCGGGDLVCCLEIESPRPSVDVPKVCDGTCVPFFQCLNGTINNSGQGVINLRSFDDICAGELVCCSTKPKPSSNSCQCVPFHQCLDDTVDTGVRSLLDLRSHEQYCTGDQVCCSNPRPSHTETTNSNECKGMCVPFYQCNMAGKDVLNLRSYDECPSDKICCELSAKGKQPESIQIGSNRPIDKLCDGACVPLVRCADSPKAMMNHLIDLRFGSIHNGCLDGNICCANPIRLSPNEEEWIDWIKDMNNMVNVAQNIKKAGKCFLNMVQDTESIKEDEIPWLVTVWRSQHRLGVMQDEYLCVGTLVRSDVVLVPADCFQNDPYARLVVRTGNYDLKANSGYEKLQTTRKIIHPNYDNAYSPNNVALLFLTERSKPKPPAACIFDFNEQFREQECLIVGWNSLDLLDASNSFTVPKKLNLPIVRSTTCRSGTFCTGRNQFGRSCDRLHGSPVICLDQSGHNWKIAGMVTRNNVRCDQNGIPESLLEVTRLEPWIREQLSPSFAQKSATHEPSRKYLPIM